jgi:hypothetical protein
MTRITFLDNSALRLSNNFYVTYSMILQASMKEDVPRYFEPNFDKKIVRLEKQIEG